MIAATYLRRSHHESAPRRSGCVRPGRAFAPHRLRTCACRRRHPKPLRSRALRLGWRTACSLGLDAMDSPQRSQAPVRQSFPRYVRVNTLLASLRDVLIHLQVCWIAAVHCTRLLSTRMHCEHSAPILQRRPGGKSRRATPPRHYTAPLVVPWCVHVACRTPNLASLSDTAGKLPRTGGAD